MASKIRNIELTIERWEMKSPFRITGHVFHSIDILIVRIRENGCVGSGEAVGIYYQEETGQSILKQAKSVSEAVELGLDRQALRSLLPVGGARNAIDCALWDLEAKLSNKGIWDLTRIEAQETRSFFTIGIDTPDRMALMASSLESDRIKVKLDAELPLERIMAVRKARPDAQIIVDVNQGWDFDQLVELAPKFKKLGVSMIEQPLPRGADYELESYESPVPLCADESCLGTGEFEQAARRYQIINIKLDKTGGLTEALDLAKMAKVRGIGLMVGNMGGTSLAMAPGYVIAQLCEFVDLDGAEYLKSDRKHPMIYDYGLLSSPSRALWG